MNDAFISKNKLTAQEKFLLLNIILRLILNEISNVGLIKNIYTLKLLKNFWDWDNEVYIIIKSNRILTRIAVIMIFFYNVQ